MDIISHCIKGLPDFSDVAINITERNGYIVSIGFCSVPEGEAPCAPTPLLVEAELQLREYFNRKRTTFSLPLKLEGTEFQMLVWRELQKIPYGKTISYGQLAENINRPGSARAVGGANNKNPIGIVIPCHRVIGADGSLTGYAGGMENKRKLLLLEHF